MDQIKSEADMALMLMHLIDNNIEEPALECAVTRDFRAHGMLTRNEGLVVRLADGSEYQVTVVRSA